MMTENSNINDMHYSSDILFISKLANSLLAITDGAQPEYCKVRFDIRAIGSNLSLPDINEYNYVINAEHPEFSRKVHLVRTEEYFWDSRLL
jgi:hypothetical protein